MEKKKKEKNFAIILTEEDIQTVHQAIRAAMIAKNEEIDKARLKLFNLKAEYDKLAEDLTEVQFKLMQTSKHEERERYLCSKCRIIVDLHKTMLFYFSGIGMWCQQCVEKHIGHKCTECGQTTTASNPSIMVKEREKVIVGEGYSRLICQTCADRKIEEYNDCEENDNDCDGDVDESTSSQGDEGSGPTENVDCEGENNDCDGNLTLTTNSTIASG